MRGNEKLGKILLENYSIDVTKYLDNMIWEFIEENQIEKVMVSFPNIRTSNNLACLCDKNWMLWYGDYGAFSFNCTWKTSIKNIPVELTDYLWEKYDTPNKHDQKDWSCVKCGQSLLNTIRQSSGYEDLTEEQRKALEDCLASPFNSVWEYSSLEEHEEYLNQIVTLYRAAFQNKIEFQYMVEQVDYDNNFIAVEPYSLYNIGEVLPKSYFIILYVLSIVQVELEK